MTKLKLRDKRKKAQFGESIVAAGIQAAATAASAIMGAAATAKASKEQAAAQEAAAKSEAEALQAQNENNNRLQKQQIEATKLENEKIRTLEESNQETLQMLAGMQNTNARKDAAKIQAKYGTILQTPQVVAPMDGNMPVITKDGGYLQFLRKSNTGKDIYLAVGAKHNQKHKARNGRTVGGIGLELPLFNTKPKTNVEVEGDEVVTVGTNEVEVSTTHDVLGDGESPAEKILKGEDPDYVNYKQEIAKQYSKINDDGTKMKNVKRTKHTAGGIVQPFPPQPNLLLAGSTTPIGGIIASQKQDIPQLKYGGRLKAKDGDEILNDVNKSVKTAGWINGSAQVLGAGINTIGNFIGAYHSKKGLQEASNHLLDAYNKMHGIDPSIISRDDYRSAHAMAALQAPIVDTGAERASIERGLARANEQIKNNTVSAAAAQNRSAIAQTNAFDILNKVEQGAYNKKQDIIQGNMQRITAVSDANANRDVQAIKDYTNAKLDIAKYNNSIENEKIAGIGKTKADLAKGLADIKSNRALANAQNWANATTNVGTIAGATGDTIGKNKFNWATTLAGATKQGAAELYARNGEWDKVLDIYNAFKGLNTDEAKYFINMYGPKLKEKGYIQ